MKDKDKKSVIQMDDQTWRIVEGMGSGSVYSYLLAGSSAAVLIDTGMGLLDLKKITEELTPLPVSVINTHGHLDHISCNHQFETAYLHPADEDLFIQHSAYDFRYIVLEGLLAEAKMPAWLLKLPILRSLAKNFCTIPQRNNRQPLAEGMQLDLGGRTLEIICTPGHSPGSVCIIDIERQQLFSGDTVCAEGVLLMLDQSTSVETFKGSILHLQAASDRFDTIWPGHHQLPLDISWMDDYIECADLILSGSGTRTSVSSPIGDGELASQGRIAISYRADNIRDNLAD